MRLPPPSPSNKKPVNSGQIWALFWIKIWEHVWEPVRVGIWALFGIGKGTGGLVQVRVPIQWRMAQNLAHFIRTKQALTLCLLVCHTPTQCTLLRVPCFSSTPGSSWPLPFASCPSQLWLTAPWYNLRANYWSPCEEKLDVSTVSHKHNLISQQWTFSLCDSLMRLQCHLL